jgi:glycosyltransferase involved in cell wall biosynthesis
MEFMACAMPVIMSRTLIDTTYFTDDHVWFFSPGDPSLADTIYWVYSRPEEALRKVKASLELVSQNNWEVKKHNYLRIVESLVHGQCPG